jgi:K+-sensing histidine kinase KdpD
MLKETETQRLMVCIGSEPGASKLLHAAHRMAEDLKIPWIAVYVETVPQFHSMEWHRYQALEHLSLAKQLGAETEILTGPDIVIAILECARTRQVTRLVVGRSFVPTSLPGRILGSPLSELMRRGADMEIRVLPDGGKDRPSARLGRSSFSSGWRSYGFALIVLLACNSLAWLFSGFLGLTNLLLIYLVGILTVIAKTGKGPSTLTCILGVLSFDFFIVPPRFAFAPTDSQYLITLGVVLVITLVINELIRRHPGMSVHPLPELDVSRGETENRASLFSTYWGSYGFALVVLLACNALAWVCSGFLALTNILMIYLIGVLVVVSKTGKGPSTFTCVLGVLSFDFFMVPPRFAFAPTDSQYLITLMVVLGITLSISELMARARHQTDILRLRENRTAYLFKLSQELAVGQEVERLFPVAVKHIAEISNGRVAILMPAKNGKLEVQAGLEPEFVRSPLEQRTIHWAYRMGKMAGRGTPNIPDAEAFYLPLIVSGETVGILAVEPWESGRSLATEQRHLLQAIANQIGAAIENARLSVESQRVLLQAETEQMRNALLSSVSHDLRTPLAVITGSASSLLDPENHLGEDARQELIQGIYSEAERLNRLLSNLLEMTKLSAGKVLLKKEVQPLEEVVEVALSRLEKKLEGRRVHVDIPENLPMLPLDSLLMEQVFINLLENSVKYTPAGSPIAISARVEGSLLRAEIADRGPGLAPGVEEKVFEKFYQVSQTGPKGGVGLGLAICRGVVEAHGGKIWAENRPGGGAVFCFTLPLEPDPVKTGSK